MVWRGIFNEGFTKLVFRAGRQSAVYYVKVLDHLPFAKSCCQSWVLGTTRTLPLMLMFDVFVRDGVRAASHVVLRNQ